VPMTGDRTMAAPIGVIADVRPPSQRQQLHPSLTPVNEISETAPRLKADS